MSGGVMLFVCTKPFHKLLHAIIGIALLFLLCAPVTAHAQAGSAAISQGFPTTDTTLSNGTLVSLQRKNQSAVGVANPNNASLLVGVVGTQPLLALSGSGEQVQVVISGITPALVSDINGPIKVGDKITASPISGVGMNTTASTQIVGTAQTDFNIATAQSRTITDTNGHTHTVHVGLVPIQINVEYYNIPPSKSSVLPSFLQNFANSIAGRDVSALRLFLSAVILLLGLVSVGVLMSSAVRSSIISIGRNPLSENAVQKSLFKVGGMGFGILLLVLVAIYLTLRM